MLVVPAEAGPPNKTQAPGRKNRTLAGSIDHRPKEVLEGFASDIGDRTGRRD